MCESESLNISISDYPEPIYARLITNILCKLSSGSLPHITEEHPGPSAKSNQIF